MKDLMVDIETFGTDSNSVIVTISAVLFDLKTGDIGGIFERAINIQEQMDKGAIMDGDTVMWWLSQSKEAQKSLTAIKSSEVEAVLISLNTFCSHHQVDKLWGNGATFDNVIIRNLYKRSGVEFEIPFWADRDVRTLVDLAGIDTRDYKFTGTKHNAVDDCLHQIKYCVDANKILKGK